MRKILSIIFAAAFATQLSAQCPLFFSVANSEQSPEVSGADIEYLNERLTQLASAEGFVSAPGMTQFAITAKFNKIYQETLAGPPVQTAVRTYLTLYAVDSADKSIYASESFELRGTGTSESRAYINALRQLSPNNKKITGFFASARKKILDYYDNSYPQILAKAKKFAERHDYEAALWYASKIPECSKGYGEASQLQLEYFKKYIDARGLDLYTRANAFWSTSPDAEGAQQAYALLAEIDPDAACYGQALKLMQEMKTELKSDKEFEMRTKYADALDIDRRRLDAAREVGVAYGKGQQPSTTYINWIK